VSRQGGSIAHDLQEASVPLSPQMPCPGDHTSDGSIVWPESRKIVELSTLSLTAVAPDNEKLQRDLMYNPIFLTAGIQLSDDPMSALRSAVSALSVAHRR
jgi:catalase